MPQSEVERLEGRAQLREKTRGEQGRKGEDGRKEERKGEDGRKEVRE